MKYCVITCIFNNYDILRDPDVIDDNCDYYCVTDDPSLKSNIWQTIYAEELDTDDLTGLQKTYKFKYACYKYVPNIEQYDFFIQMDASIKIMLSLKPIIEYMNRYKYDISIAPHPFLKTIKEEYDATIAWRGMDKKYRDIFRKFAEANNFNNVKGICECTFKIYKNCKEALNFIDDVYNTLFYVHDALDRTDQGYFTYIVYKHLDKLRFNFHQPSLYRDSKYMQVGIHGSEERAKDGAQHVPDIMEFLNKYIHVTPNDAYEGL